MICPHCLYDHARVPARCESCRRPLGGVDEPPGPFVGRARELALLDEQLEAVVKNRAPRFIALVGPPRSGRSRLMSELQRRHDNAFSDVVSSRGYPVPGRRAADPYAPFGRLLHNCLGMDDQWPEAQRRAHFQARIEALGPPALSDALETLGRFVGLRFPSPDGPVARPDAEQRTFASFAWYLRQRADRHPLLALIEGFDRATREGRALLAYLHQHLAGCALLMLVEVRAGADPPGELERAVHGVLAVEPLGRDATGDLLRRLVDRAQPPPANLLDTVHAVTGGRPDAVAQVAQSLEAHDITPVGGSGWGVDPEAALRFEFPLTAEEAARRRLADLDEPDRELLRRAAAVGPVFWRGALVPALRVPHAPDALSAWEEAPDAEAVDATLSRAVRLGIVHRMGDSQFPGEPELAFTRPREHELLLDELGSALRGRVHAVVAQWLEAHGAESEGQLLRIAEHYEAGGNGKRAAWFFIRAGEQARARYATESAVAAFEQARALLDERDALALVDVHHALGALHVDAGRHEQALVCFERMLACAWVLDHQAKAGAALNRLGRLMRARSDHDRARALLEQGRQLFVAAGDAAGVAASNDDLGQVALLCGEEAEARRLFEEALRYRRAANDERAIALSMTNLARLWRDAGARVEAERALREAIELRERAGDLAGLLDSRLELAEVLLREDQLQAASAEAEIALEVARSTGARGPMARALALTAWLLVERGELPEAGPYAAEAAALAEQLGDVRSRVRALRAGGLAAPSLARGLILVGEAVALARRHGDRFETAAARLAEARLRAAVAGFDAGPRVAPRPPGSEEPATRVAELEAAVAAGVDAMDGFEELGDVDLADVARVLVERLLDGYEQLVPAE